jgi:polyvinyl alcohol dehydrogenase (cytochrome)
VPAAGAISRPSTAITPTTISPTAIGPFDWPTYGHDIEHTFNAPTDLTPSNVQGLAPKWFFPTKDAVTANPILVGNTVYVGSWDGHFYAIDAKTGALRWQYRVKAQPAVIPPPDGNRKPGSLSGGPLAVVQDETSDGGIITASAFFLPGNVAAHRPDLVIFGGGFTLYALRADNGKEWFRPHDYPGLPDAPAQPAKDEARIFSSPVVVGNQIFFGVTSDGQSGHRGYFVSADLTTGRQRWRFETDIDTLHHKPQNDGCGGVWSSPTIDANDGLLVFDVADCDFFGNHSSAGVQEPYNQRVIALRMRDGALRWVFTPPRLDPKSPEYNRDPNCDWDFGATANLATLPGGVRFLGVGGKDGTYYSLDPATGRLLWHTNVVFGGLSGGFLATTAVDPVGARVYGATALGDFGRFEGFGTPSVCKPGNLADLPVQDPSQYAFDAATGKVVWRSGLSQSFGPLTVAGGMTFVGSAVAHQVQIRDAHTGSLIDVLPLLADSDSGIVVTRRGIYVGTGTSEQGVLAGVYFFGLQTG